MTTINLINSTGLTATEGTAWVAGFNGGAGCALGSTGNGQGTFSAATQEFFAVGAGANEINTITFDSGGGRLIFIVSATQPPAMVAGQGAFTPAPYPTAPAVLPTGPQDFFEFSYTGNDDLTAVQGFGLNLTFEVPKINGTGVTETYGAAPGVSRQLIGSAYTTFMANDALGGDFADLLYPSANYALPSAITVPLGQFFEICDPFDWVTNYPQDALATYWDDTLTHFFADHNYLSINLSSNPNATNIYSGQCLGGAYSLSNGTNTYVFTSPGTGLPGAQYVFGQTFAATPDADQGLLQDSIWQALCRGVALDGVSTTPITDGITTTAWNDQSKWYTQHTSTAFPTFTPVYHTYAKFLHLATLPDSTSPLFLGGSAYGFSEDENPVGPYSGSTPVPSKTLNIVGPNDTVTITIGPWRSGD